MSAYFFSYLLFYLHETDQGFATLKSYLGLQKTLIFEVLYLSFLWYNSQFAISKVGQISWPVLISTFSLAIPSLLLREN